MYAYSMVQWLAFFYIYCIFGWCFESAYVSLLKRHPVNRGFMTGPYLPLYGSGAVLVLYVTLPVRDNYILMYLLGAAAATVLEYFTGVAMERLFGVRYWDYSDQKFNFRGQICLSSTIAWGFLTLFLVEVIQRPIEQVILHINENILTMITFCFTVIFTFDFASSFRTAIDLKDVLVQAERAKKELDRLQKRVDVFEAVINDSVGNLVEDIGDRVSERRQKINELTEERMAELAVHMDTIRQKMEDSETLERVRKAVDTLELDGHIDDLQDEIRQMRIRLEGLSMGAKERLHPRQIRMLRRNPSAKSLRYREEWQGLKDKIKRSADDRRR